MSEMRDITEPFVTRPEFQAELDKFQAKVMGFPAVKDCQVKLTSLKGASLGDDKFALLAKGEIQVSGPMAMKIRLEAEGDCEMAGRNISIKEVRVLNDVGGMMGRLLNWTGMAKGGSIKLSQRDAKWLSTALA